jgi:predicted nucleic acid-binding protein
MLRYLLDTDHLTLFHHGHPLVGQRLYAHPPGTVGISVVTVQEALQGRLAAVAQARDGPSRIRDYAFLHGTLRDIAPFPIVDYDPAVEDEFQRIRHIRIGMQDLRIAATALANQLIVATCNRRDFAKVPGHVIEDWSI